MEMGGIIVGVLFSLFTLAVCKNQVPHRSCDSAAKYEATVSEVDTDADVTSNMIQLKKGSNVTVSFSFKMMSGDATSATSVVHGVIGGLPVPFSIPNPNACKDSGLSCPLKPPSSYTYKTVIPVPSDSPSIKLFVKWLLKDQNGSAVWCQEMPAEITG